MLAVPGGIAPPSIVGDHKQQLCAVAGEPTKESAIGRLIANGRTNRWPAITRLYDLPDRIGANAAYCTSKIDGKFIHKGEVFTKRHLLHTRHQNRFVVE